jgi:hypothetical protein
VGARHRSERVEAGTGSREVVEPTEKVGGVEARHRELGRPRPEGIGGLRDRATHAADIDEPASRRHPALASVKRDLR